MEAVCRLTLKNFTTVPSGKAIKTTNAPIIKIGLIFLGRSVIQAKLKKAIKPSK